VVARHAGEMLPELTLAVARGVGLGKIARTIHTYPTQAEAIRKDGGRLQPDASHAAAEAALRDVAPVDTLAGGAARDHPVH